MMINMPVALMSRVNPGSLLIETGRCAAFLAERLCLATWRVFEFPTGGTLMRLGYVHVRTATHIHPCRYSWFGVLAPVLYTQDNFTYLSCQALAHLFACSLAPLDFNGIPRPIALHMRLKESFSA